jgi:ribosomal protein S18 acetylase RimI-like enzyme
MAVEVRTFQPSDSEGIREVLWRGRGAGRIVLAVEAANDRATRLYRAHGFEPIIEWPHRGLALD